MSSKCPVVLCTKLSLVKKLNIKSDCIFSSVLYSRGERSPDRHVVSWGTCKGPLLYPFIINTGRVGDANQFLFTTCTNTVASLTPG